jgi:hypothetical protein
VLTTTSPRITFFDVFNDSRVFFDSPPDWCANAAALWESTPTRTDETDDGVATFVPGNISVHMKPSVIVWDLETVPDLPGFAAANDLVGKRDADIREALGNAAARLCGGGDSSAIQRAAELTGAGPGQQPMTHLCHPQPIFAVMDHTETMW